MNKIRRIITIYFLFSIFYLLSSYSCNADTVYMQDGTIVKGLVVEEHHDIIVFSTPDGEITIPREDIDEIFFDVLEQNYYYLANKFLNNGEFEVAEKFYNKALGVSPGYIEVQKGLSRLKDKREKEIKKWKTADSLETLKNQIGVSIARDGDFCKVKKAFREGTPLAADDAVVAVWDESTKFMPEKDVAERIAGVPDTSVIITIQRTARLRLGGAPWFLKMFGMFGLKNKESLPLEMETEGLVVGKVSQASSVARRGLRQGDRITSIAGKPTRYMPLNDARTLIKNRVKKGVELVIRRDIELVRETK